FDLDLNTVSTMRKFLLGALSGAIFGIPVGASLEWSLNRRFPESFADDQAEVIYQGRSTGSWLRQLEDRDPVYRLEAVQAFEKIGPRAEGVVTALGGLLKDLDPLVRVGAAGALRRLGPEARPALPLLLVAVEDENQFVRANVAAALGLIGRDDGAVLVALAK